jgi:hypothetical protein
MVGLDTLRKDNSEQIIAGGLSKDNEVSQNQEVNIRF